jgi:hypothetical protein
MSLGAPSLPRGTLDLSQTLPGYVGSSIEPPRATSVPVLSPARAIPLGGTNNSGVLIRREVISQVDLQPSSYEMRAPRGSLPIKADGSIALDRPRPADAALPRPMAELLHRPSTNVYHRVGIQAKLAYFGGGVQIKLYTDSNASPRISWGKSIEIVREALGREEPPSDVDSVFDRARSTLVRKLSPKIGWEITRAWPQPVLFSAEVGENFGDFVHFEGLHKAIGEGAVLFDPSAPPYRRYRLNTAFDSATQTHTMKVPLKVGVAERAAVTPQTVLLNDFPIPEEFKTVLKKAPAAVGFAAWRETEATIKGEIDTDLMHSIDESLNDQFARKFNKPVGMDMTLDERFVHFALPNTVPSWGSHTLPQGWGSVVKKLVPEEVRRDPNRWAQITQIALSGKVAGINDLKLSAGAYAWKLELPPTEVKSVATAVSEGRAREQPYRGLTLPEGFTIGLESLERMSLSPDLPILDPKATATLLLKKPDLPVFEIPVNGAVLNAIHGWPVAAGDIPSIVSFLREIDPARRSVTPPRASDIHPNAQGVYDVVSRIEPGQPLSIEARTEVLGQLYNFEGRFEAQKLERWARRWEHDPSADEWPAELSYSDQRQRAETLFDELRAGAPDLPAELGERYVGTLSDLVQSIEETAAQRRANPLPNEWLDPRDPDRIAHPEAERAFYRYFGHLPLSKTERLQKFWNLSDEFHHRDSLP